MTTFDKLLVFAVVVILLATLTTVHFMSQKQVVLNPANTLTFTTPWWTGTSIEKVEVTQTTSDGTQRIYFDINVFFGAYQYGAFLDVRGGQVIHQRAIDGPDQLWPNGHYSLSFNPDINGFDMK